MNSLLSANIACLGQGIEFLQQVPAALYCKACSGVFGSTMGGHFRHNLDHYGAFFDGLENGEIDYDSRDRDKELEESPGRALLQLKEISRRLEYVDEMDLDRPLKIRMDDGGGSTWSRTTLRRELQFLLSHTIHHYALMVSIATQNDFNEFPEGFGVAPSTVHHHQKKGD